VRLVADANVLLSAILGGAAARVLRHPQVEAVMAAAPALDEVHEYAIVLARERGLKLETLLTAVVTLPVTVVDRDDYAPSLPEAARRMARRDPDDVETLALALHLRLPVWSNDDDFRGMDVPWFTTARLLKALDAP
jgi:predicted nucleic acid-binding protein